MLLNTLNTSRTDALLTARPKASALSTDLGYQAVGALVSAAAPAAAFAVSTSAFGMCEHARQDFAGSAYATTTGLTNDHVIGAVREEWTFAPNGTKHHSQRERRT